MIFIIWSEFDVVLGVGVTEDVALNGVSLSSGTLGTTEREVTVGAGVQTAHSPPAPGTAQLGDGDCDKGEVTHHNLQGLDGAAGGQHLQSGLLLSDGPGQTATSMFVPGRTVSTQLHLLAGDTHRPLLPTQETRGQQALCLLLLLSILYGTLLLPLLILFCHFRDTTECDHNSDSVWSL